MGDFANRPKILRGAFVEFGISVPPLMVVFQFNPLTISRSRSSYVNPPLTPMGTQSEQNADFIQQIATGGASSLIQFRNGQNIIVQPQTISFDIRLDATDKLDQGARQYHCAAIAMFAKGSRYRNLTQSSPVNGRGGRLRGTDLRLIEPTSGQFLHTVRDRDRLDLLAYKYYADPTRWWQICDANPQFAFPNDLLDRGPLQD